MASNPGEPLAGGRAAEGDQEVRTESGLSKEGRARAAIASERQGLGPLLPARNLARDLLDRPFHTLGRLQEKRGLWISGALFALAMEIFTVLYYQKHLGLLPSEYCVQIRLDTLVVFLGGTMAALMPSLKPLRLAGWLAAFGGAAVGLKNSLALEAITVKTLFDPNYFPICQPGKVDFVFGLPLDKWLPTHFSPSGICGEGSRQLLHFHMTQWLIVAFSLMAASLLMVLASWLAQARQKGGKAA